MGLVLNPFALALSSAVIVAVTAAAGLAGADPLSTIAVSVIAAAVALQLGYLGGALGRFLILPVVLQRSPHFRGRTVRAVR
jgi:hypothetical protein